MAMPKSSGFHVVSELFGTSAARETQTLHRSLDLTDVWIYLRQSNMITESDPIHSARCWFGNTENSSNSTEAE